MDYFKDEDDFQRWLTARLNTDGWHVQVHRGDDRYPGVPDLSAATTNRNVWIENKYARGTHHAENKIDLQHPLSAQQRDWLTRRQLAAGFPCEESFTYCGVMLPFMIGPDEGPQIYVAYVPIGMWAERRDSIIWNWALSPHTAKLEWLMTGQCRIIDLIEGNLTPGWGARTGAQRQRRG